MHLSARKYVCSSVVLIRSLNQLHRVYKLMTGDHDLHKELPES